MMLLLRRCFGGVAFEEGFAVHILVAFVFSFCIGGSIYDTRQRFV